MLSEYRQSDPKSHHRAIDQLHQEQYGEHFLEREKEKRKAVNSHGSYIIGYICILTCEV